MISPGTGAIAPSRGRGNRFRVFVYLGSRSASPRLLPRGGAWLSDRCRLKGT